METIIKEISSIIENLENRTPRDYEFTSKTQEIYDKWQLDAYKYIINLLNKLK